MSIYKNLCEFLCIIPHDPLLILEIGTQEMCVYKNIWAIFIDGDRFLINLVKSTHRKCASIKT